MDIEEVSTGAVRIDSFLAREYPNKRNVAVWIDVEGYSYQVLVGIHDILDYVYVYT